MRLKYFLSKIFILSFIVLPCINCEPDRDNLYKLNYGTSFNNCKGYCKNEMILEHEYVTYFHTAWVDSIEPITCLDNLNEETWLYIKNQLNYSRFLSLPNTIGCPDCADGGAEWIEVEMVSGEKHKVTFEYGNQPKFLNDYVVVLREQMSKSTHCGEF